MKTASVQTVEQIALNLLPYSSTPWLEMVGNWYLVVSWEDDGVFVFRNWGHDEEL